jgi:predicted transcriptional regulator
MTTASRPKVDGKMVMAVAHRLTERDRAILTMIYRHRVFTTDQLAEMYFDNINTAQHRLTTLYQLRLVDRFQPIDRRYVSQPYHYVLDHLGAMVGAAEQDRDPDQTHWQQEKALAIGRSQRLGHLVGTNGFFSALMAESRHRDDCALSLWWSERSCTANFNEIVRPDGLGIWEEGDASVTFCLEYDRSTETLERLEKKLKGYEDLEIASGSVYWVLFCFGHPRRESGARRALAQATVPVATAAPGPTQRPHEAIWAPIGHDGPGCDWPSWPVRLRRPSPTGGSRTLGNTVAASTNRGGGITPSETARLDPRSGIPTTEDARGSKRPQFAIRVRVTPSRRSGAGWRLWMPARNATVWQRALWPRNVRGCSTSKPRPTTGSGRPIPMR